MDSDLGESSNCLAEYFVVCGLCEKPKPYDMSKVISHGDEITNADTIDFTFYNDPIVDIKLINADEKNIPSGFQLIESSVSGKYSANLKSKSGDVYIYYRRGRDMEPIVDIWLSNKLSPRANMVIRDRTTTGLDAKLGSTFDTPAYICFTRGSFRMGVDRLAVTDLGVVFSEESCPPAFKQIQHSLRNKTGGPKYNLCFRKSLLKQYIITYEPEVLFWYRVPPMPTDIEIDDFDLHPHLDGDNLQESLISDANAVQPLDSDICQVANFCLPFGASIESWSVEQEHPKANFFTFVLTNESYKRLYGVAFTFYEPYDVRKLHEQWDKCYRLGVEPDLCATAISPSGEVTSLIDLDPARRAHLENLQGHFIRACVGDRVVGVSKTLCLLSRWSFPVAFTHFLAFLYSRCLAVNDGGMDPVPLERYLTHFLCEVPFPSPTIPNILVKLCAAPILLQLPDEISASSSCEPFFHLLDRLGVDLTIKVLVQMLTEQKILLTSVYHAYLAQIGEALIRMLFPLRWTVVFIPFISMGCVDVIQSPSPYLIGVNSRFFDFFRLPTGDGVTYVDVDTRNFRPPTVGYIEPKHLPKRPTEQLREQLSRLEKDIKLLRDTRPIRDRADSILLDRMLCLPDSNLANEELIQLQRRTFIGTRIRNTFLDFMVHILRDYRKYIIPVRVAQRDELFNKEGFLKEACEKHTRPFYKALLETQHWANFIRDRSYASRRDEELSEFDNCVDRLSVNDFGSVYSEEDSRSSSDLNLSRDLLTRPTNTNFGESGFSSSSLHEEPDESKTYRQLTAQQPVSDTTRIVNTPSWPIPSLDEKWSRNLFVLDREPYASLDHGHQDNIVPNAVTITDHGYGVFPTNFNTSVLDQLSLYAYRYRSAASTAVLGPCYTDSGPGFDRSFPITAPLTDPLSHRSGLFPKSQLLASLNSLDARSNNSPSISRSLGPKNFTVGLTGLPTKFPLPVGNSSILRRTPQELRFAEEYAARAYENEQDWAIYFVSSIYSLWFTMLPSFFASMYVHLSVPECPVATNRTTATAAVLDTNPCTRTQQTDGDVLNGCVNENEGNTNATAPKATTERNDGNQTSQAALDSVVAEAYNLIYRLKMANIPFIDQAACRILLALIFQHRTPYVGVMDFLDSITWNSSSTGLVNFIYKALEREEQDEKRQQREFIIRQQYLNRKQAAGFPTQHHRSASATCAINDTSQTVNDSIASTDDRERSGTNRQEPDVNQTTLLTVASSPVLNVSSSTMTQSVMVLPATTVSCHDSIISTSSFADPTGVQVEDSPSGDGVSHERPSNDTLPVDTHLQVMQAPLAAVDDTLDLDSSPSNQDRSQKQTEATIEFSAIASNDTAVDPMSSMESNLKDNVDTFANVIAKDSGSKESPQTVSNRQPHPLLSEHPKEETEAISNDSRLVDSLTKSVIPGDSPDTGSVTGRWTPRDSLHQINNKMQIIGKSTTELFSKFFFGSSPAPARSSVSSITHANNSPSVSISIAEPNQRRPDSGWNWKKYQNRSSNYYRISADASPSKSWQNVPTNEPVTSLTDELDSMASVPKAYFVNEAPLWSSVAGGFLFAAPNQHRYAATLATMLRDRAQSTTTVATTINQPSSSQSVTKTSSAIPATMHSTSPNGNSTITDSPDSGGGSAAYDSGAVLDDKDCGTRVKEPLQLHTNNTASSPNVPDDSLGKDENLSPEPSSKSHLTSVPDIASNLLPVVQLTVHMTTCNYCPKCTREVYDEEIMASWRFSTITSGTHYSPIHCPFCTNEFQPEMVLRIFGMVPRVPVPMQTNGDRSTRCPSTDRLLNTPSSPRVMAESAVPSTGSPSRSHRRMSNIDTGRMIPLESKLLCELKYFYLSPFVLRDSLELVLHREGDRCFRLHTDTNSMLYQHEALTWNLVWYMHRIGLPTDLLDTLPAWLMTQQQSVSQQQSAIRTSVANTHRPSPHSLLTMTETYFMQVQLSPSLPVRITLLWNPFPSAVSLVHQPLYRQWMRRKSRCTSEWSLVSQNKPGSPILNPGSLGFSSSSSCSVEATIARVVEHISNDRVDIAIDSLIRLRASVVLNRPLFYSKQTNASAAEQSTTTSTTTTDGMLSAAENHVTDASRHHQCVSATHKSSSFIRGSLYRELLFLTICAIDLTPNDLVQFDKRFFHSSQRFRGDPFFMDTDKCPTSVALHCRYMLRRLALSP